MENALEVESVFDRKVFPDQTRRFVFTRVFPR